MQFVIDDDSGILGLLDCDAYFSYVAEDWEYEQLISHFKRQAELKTIFVWDAGDGGNTYRVEVRKGISQLPGVRSAVGSLNVTQGRLIIASYTALTMAAQYADEPLPAKTESDLTVPLENGSYIVRIVQLAESADSEPSSPHFMLEIEPGSTNTAGNVSWFAD